MPLGRQSHRKPIIGVDASRISIGQRTGTENYSLQITRHLLEMTEAQAFSWRGYLNAIRADLAPPERDAAIEWRAMPFRRLWTHARLSREMLLQPPDVLFVPAHVVPFIHPRTVVTIHDLGYLHYPEAHTARQVRMLDLSTRWSARVARHIIVPSEVTREDLIARYGIPAAKITVIHHGVDVRFGKASPADIEAVRTQIGAPDRYILAVGTIQPRKNLQTLAEAVKILHARGLDIDVVIAGKRGWKSADVVSSLYGAGLGDHLHLVDYVEDDHLPALYQGASCFVMPSLFEGFGMPVVEAMRSSLPTLVADASCLPEILGDGGEIFAPRNSEMLADQLQRVLDDPTHATGLGQAALQRSHAFTWEDSAAKTLKILDSVIRGAL